MRLSRLVSLIFIIAGAALALYAQNETPTNSYYLIGGIVLLMIGIYRIGRNIPSKFDKQEEESFVKSEPDDDN